MLLSKLYHSVTQQDQSPQIAAQLLSFPLPLFLYVPLLLTLTPPSDVILFLPTSSVLLCLHFLSLPLYSVYQFLFPPISRYIAFLFPDYCQLNLFFLRLTSFCPSITNTGAEILNWGQ